MWKKTILFEVFISVDDSEESWYVIQYSEQIQFPGTFFQFKNEDERETKIESFRRNSTGTA